jgi:hypothetical protein
MNDSTVSRRDLFRLIAAAGATGALAPADLAAAPPPLTRNFKNVLSDPDFSDPAAPWEKPLVEAELATLALLVDLILPADELSPAASAIGVHDFLNEWAGAPYPENRADCEILRGGLAWLNTRAFQLHGNGFAALDAARRTEILDSICDPAKAAPALAVGARFFGRLRMLALGGYYSHSSTWRSLGYVGNVPIAGPYPGVPEEVIKILGLEGEI